MSEPAFSEAPDANAQAEARHPAALSNPAAVRRDQERRYAAEEAERAEADAVQRTLRSYQRDHQGNAILGGFRDDHGHQVAVVLSRTGVITVKHGAWTALQLRREQAAELATLLGRAAQG